MEEATPKPVTVTLHVSVLARTSMPRKQELAEHLRTMPLSQLLLLIDTYPYLYRLGRDKTAYFVVERELVVPSDMAAAYRKV